MLDSRKENIKLVDFGLSNHWSVESPLRTLCGSPEYSAPELFVRGSLYGPEVDMWALGVVIFSMAVGQLPFPCASVYMKDQDKKHILIKMINNGLTQTHILRIVGYPPEFLALVQGLVCPRWEERLTVGQVMADPWLTTRGRWVPQPHDTLDSFDLAKASPAPLASRSTPAETRRRKRSPPILTATPPPQAQRAAPTATPPSPPKRPQQQHPPQKQEPC